MRLSAEQPTVEMVANLNLPILLTSSIIVSVRSLSMLMQSARIGSAVAAALATIMGIVNASKVTQTNIAPLKRPSYENYKLTQRSFQTSAVAIATQK